MNVARSQPWSWLPVVATACTVASVDLDDKRCPCADGWVCNTAIDRCRAVAGASTDTAAETTSSGGSFAIEAFAADWSTPHGIHWHWEVAGVADDFHAYELWISDDAAALDDPDAAVIFDATRNPELGRFELRNTNDLELVQATITDGLQPGTEYFARLHVLDTAGGRSSSDNVAVRSTTAAPVNSVMILGDDDPFTPDNLRPTCIVRSDAAPFGDTTHHFALTHHCTADGEAACDEAQSPAPECWENLRLENLSIDIGQLDAGDFTDAFLELAIAVDAPPGTVGHGWWSTIGVGSGEMTRSFSPLTIRADGEYRVVQVPLLQMGIDHAELGGVVTGARVGSTWHTGSVIRVDEIRIRW